MVFFLGETREVPLQKMVEIGDFMGYDRVIPGDGDRKSPRRFCATWDPFKAVSWLIKGGTNYLLNGMILRV